MGDKKWKILDIGCGNGDFLSKLDSSRVERYGIEINKRGCEMCLRRGLRAYNQELTNIDFQDKKFDVITLWHVLEHTEKPMELLNKIYQILKKDGVLAFITPNTDSFGFKWGKENWFHFWRLMWHFTTLCFLTEQSFKALIKGDLHKKIEWLFSSRA